MVNLKLGSSCIFAQDERSITFTRHLHNSSAKRTFLEETFNTKEQNFHPSSIILYPNTDCLICTPYSSNHTHSTAHTIPQPQISQKFPSSSCEKSTRRNQLTSPNLGIPSPFPSPILASFPIVTAFKSTSLLTALIPLNSILSHQSKNIL